MILFFDTETTGKADFRSKPDAPHQPRLVQLGALLTDDGGEEMACIDLIITPEGFTIPESASSIHGITTDVARAYGVGLEVALPAFAQLCTKPHVIVAHNIDFDLLIMRGEYLRASCEDDPFDGAKLFCTMQAMTPICNIPGPYGPKWPKLIEAYRHCFGEDFSGAHSAMADVRACARVYRWLQDRKGQ